MTKDWAEDEEESWEEADLEEEGEGAEEGQGPASQPWRLSLRVDAGQDPMRIDLFLMHRIEGATRNKIQHGLESGHILVNGQRVKPSYKVKPGDMVQVADQRPSTTLPFVPTEMPLDIRYEDDTLLVVYKPAGLVVHPGCGNREGTLIHGLAHHLQWKPSQEETLPRVGLVHRIDKDTTGLLVVAKTPKAMASLAKQFKKHKVHRRYQALVWGTPPEAEGRIEAHIGRDQRFRKIMAVYPDGDHGKAAITHYRLLETFHYVSLLELQLETGRTHQIRVHMKHIGHPLFNDATYGGDRIRKGTIFSKYRQFVDNCFALLPRHALHAKELGFRHPETGEEMIFQTELPEDMQQVLEKWRQYTRGMSPGLKEHLDKGGGA